MDIGPLEYIVIGLQDHHLTSEILPALNTIQDNGLIRVVDLLFLNKAADGIVTIQEVSELSEDEQQLYGRLLEDLTGLLTAQDVEHLAKELPPETLAIVVLLEHTWTIGLAEAVRKAGGVLFTGGMVTSEALEQVRAELATAKEEYHA